MFDTEVPTVLSPWRIISSKDSKGARKLTIAKAMTGFGLLCCFAGGEVKDRRMET